MQALPSRQEASSKVAQASLASQYRLRAKLLGELMANLPKTLHELEEVIDRHATEWMDREFPALVLPQPILYSNIAAFLDHALDSSTLSRQERQELFALWFEQSDSPLYRHMRVNSPECGSVRRYCCVRYRLPGIAKCRTCPLC